MKGSEAELFVHCRGGLTGEECARVEELLPRAVDEVVVRWPKSGLGELDELEVSLVDDATLARVHGEFLDDPTATDVITFDHGEILISVEMAESRAQEFGKETWEEVLLYLVHGLLHLAGFQDKAEDERREMAELQEEIWAGLVA
ncbi:MAG: rRNA maturation RNase YbeY [Verrucomicrobiota bacterium]